MHHARWRLPCSRGWWIGGVVAALTTAPAFAGTMQYFDPDSLTFPDYGRGYNYFHIQAGNDYKAVGELNIYVGDTFEELELAGFGSGTLIHDHDDPTSVWVLTAAHVVDIATHLTFNLPVSEEWEFIDDTLFRSVDYDIYTATEWYTPDTWTGFEDNAFVGNDIALVKLSSSPVTGSGVMPMHLLDTNPGEGTEFEIVGFGLTGDGYSGQLYNTGHRRAGTNTVDFSMAGGAILLSDFDAPAGAGYEEFVTEGDDWPVSMEYLIASGDSGGPDVLGNFIFGVHSFGWGLLDLEADSSFLDYSGSISTAVWYDWILDVMNASDRDELPPDAIRGAFLDAILDDGGGGAIEDHREAVTAALWEMMFDEYAALLQTDPGKAAELLAWLNLNQVQSDHPRYENYQGLLLGLATLPDGITIPEPASALALLSVGAAGLVLRRRR